MDAEVVEIQCKNLIKPIKPAGAWLDEDSWPGNQRVENAGKPASSSSLSFKFVNDTDEAFSFKTIIEVIVFKEFESKVEWLDCSGTSIASSAKGSRLRLNQVCEVFQIFQWQPEEMNIQLIQIMAE